MTNEMPLLASLASCMQIQVLWRHDCQRPVSINHSLNWLHTLLLANMRIWTHTEGVLLTSTSVYDLLATYTCHQSFHQATIKREMGYLSWLHSGKHPMLEEAYPLHIAKDREALSSELKWSFAPWRQLNVSMVRDYFGE